MPSFPSLAYSIYANYSHLGRNADTPLNIMGVIFMGVVGLDIISKRVERRKYLPLEIRAKMYEDVIELRRQGLTYKEIQKIIYEKYRKRLPIPTIFCWTNKKSHPLGNVNKFDEKPSPELAYVIGVILSDGYKYFDSKGYLLRLAVNDKEYAEEFGRCLAKVVGKKKPYKPFWDENRKQWTVAECSILLFKFLEKPFEKLKFYIEYSEETVASFLRAMFDGEGCIYVKFRRERKLLLHNTNKELLSYIQYLLKKYFDIDTTGLHLARKSGKNFNFPNGVYKTTKNYYYLYICTKSLLNFHEHISFTIKRKQQRLIKAIKQ
jgi:intein-encoded DNA endonuclease-like protein